MPALDGHAAEGVDGAAPAPPIDQWNGEQPAPTSKDLEAQTSEGMPKHASVQEHSANQAAPASNLVPDAGHQGPPADCQDSTAGGQDPEAGIPGHVGGVPEHVAGDKPAPESDPATEVGSDSKKQEYGEEMGQSLDQPMPPMPEEDKEVIPVDFGGKDDKFCPQRWSIYLRVYITIISGLVTLCCAFASSAPSFTLMEYPRIFHTTPEVSKAMVFLYVAGFCTGPLVWGPLSEVYGRWIIMVGTFAGFTLFNVGCAEAKNVVGMIFCRILAGACASSSLTVTPAILVSLWSAKTLGVGISLFSIAPMAGPALGPIAGGFIMNSGINWRWTFWVCTIFSGVCTALLATFPETLEIHCLRKKAEHLRKTTGNPHYRAKGDQGKIDWGKETEKALLMPFKLFFFEPMLIVITLYISFVYGVLYLLFEAYPEVFIKIHRMNPGDTSLTFLGYFGGSLTGALIYAFFINPRYGRELREKQKENPKVIALAPEKRLSPAMIGGPTLVVSLFWFAWTSYDDVTIWAPLFAGAFIGLSFLFIFLSLMCYIAETYFPRSASAIAANTVVRSAFGVGFPMFGEQMYDKLNPRWATTLLAFLALAMAPMPFVLVRYGAFLRSKARYAFG